MRNFIIYLFVLLISNIYAQCDNYNEPQCSINQMCDWVEDIESVTCASLAWNEELCEAAPECTYRCDDGGGYFGWCNAYCGGGMTYIDNSYCQEIEISECSSLLTESNCNDLDECEWVENMEIENCYDILDCTPSCAWQDCEALEGCNWLWDSYPSGCYGEHEVYNSYCEETEYQLGDLNQDNIINIQDVVIVIHLILDGEINLSADLNLDGSVDVLDIIQLVNIILA